jgi:hypothetical protein
VELHRDTRRASLVVPGGIDPRGGLNFSPHLIAAAGAALRRGPASTRVLGGYFLSPAVRIIMYFI